MHEHEKISDSQQPPSVRSYLYSRPLWMHTFILQERINDRQLGYNWVGLWIHDTADF